MKQCANCRRPIPIEEPLTNGQCRICAKLPARLKVATLPAKDTTPKSWVTCYRCKGPKRPSQAMCAPCMRVYKRERRRVRERLSDIGEPSR